MLQKFVKTKLSTFNTPVNISCHTYFVPPNEQSEDIAKSCETKNEEVKFMSQESRSYNRLWEIKEMILD